MVRGCICALVTPFDNDGQLDHGALRRLVRWQFESGSAAVVFAGSTGEGAALEVAEFEAGLNSVVEAAQGAAVWAGVGAPATARSVDLTRRAAALGAQAALAVTPYYLKTTDAGLLAHYRQLADCGRLPVVLYNVPSRTGVDLKPELVEQLAVHPRIVGIKEAVADLSRIRQLRQLGAAFGVYSGDDPTACQALALGADGVVSVAANVVPAEFAAMVEAGLSGDNARSAAADQALRGLYTLLAAEPNPIPVKALLARMGLVHPVWRLPLVAPQAPLALALDTYTLPRVA